jgi:rhodanese-related sulfurtransferase
MTIRHFVLSLLLIAISPLAASDTLVVHATAAEAAKLVKEKKVLVIDVRTADEFAEGHIEGAQNIDFRSTKFEGNLAAVAKTQPVLVHCASGGRSTSALKVFQKLGFLNVTHLDGGFAAWQAAGKPVVR